MERDSIDPRRIADILAAAPVWARLALTAEKESLRERAAVQMAALIVHRLDQPEGADDPRQLGLGL
jgi:hypothetical protein